MIEIGNKTKVVIGPGSTDMISYLIDFYELIGKNVLYIHGDNDPKQKCVSIKSSTLTSWDSVKNQIISNLFRLDIIIMSPNIYYDSIFDLIDSDIKIPTIYLTNGDIVIREPERLNSFDYGYHFTKKTKTSIINKNGNNPYSFGHSIEAEYYITDLKNNWTCNIVDLKTSWIRDKKLDDLLK